MSDETTGLSAGKPLTDPEADRLGYRHLAKMVADSVHRLSPADGFVVAIQGAWGSGKSSFVNFVIHDLKALPEAEQPLIATFNPWWFSGQEDLTLRFFQFLISAIKTDENVPRKKKLKKVAETITKYASQVTLPVPVVGAFVKDAAGAMHKALAGPNDVFALKQQVETGLTEFDGRILVVIDDIDRLTAEEIRQLFRLVKAVADFPKVTYLLAFDRRVVVNALEAPPVVSGDDYLEKIVQAPFDLPNPNEEEVQYLLLDELEALLAHTPPELRNELYWDRVWGGGLSHFLKTPRHVVRLANALRVTYPPVISQVNSEDFIAIEALRLFCPNAYDFLRRHKDSFAGQLNKGFDTKGDVEQLKDVYTQIAEQVPTEDQVALTGILRQVFPKYDSTFDSPAIDWFDGPLAYLRVAHPTAFEVYFHLRLPTERLTHQQMKELIESSDAGNEFAELIAQPVGNGQTRASQFVEQLEDYIQAPGFEEHAPSILHSLASWGDAIVRASPSLNTVQIAGLIFRILHQCEQPQRADIVREAIKASNALGMVVSMVYLAEYEHGLREGGHPMKVFPLVDREDLDGLRACVMEKLRAAADDGSLLQAADLNRVFFGWQVWDSIENLRQGVDRLTADDARFVTFLERFTHADQFVLSKKVVRQVGIIFNIAVVKELLDLSVAVPRASLLLLEKDLSPEDRSILEVFLHAAQGLASEAEGVDEVSDLVSSVSEETPDLEAV